MPDNAFHSHICLAGPQVSGDWDLIRLLQRKYAVTVIHEAAELTDLLLVATARLLVLDCSDQRRIAATLPSKLRGAFPNTMIVLIGGDLSQREIAAAFRDGVKDYFAYPYSVELLVERIDALCMQPTRRTDSAAVK